MTTLFITGDRSDANPFFAGYIALRMLGAAGQRKNIMTGDNAGVESLVRRIADDADFPVEVVPSPLGDDGKVDWDARHVNIAEAVKDGLEVLVVHADPMASRITPSALRVFGDDAVRIATELDLFPTA